MTPTLKDATGWSLIPRARMRLISGLLLIAVAPGLAGRAEESERATTPHVTTAVTAENSNRSDAPLSLDGISAAHWDLCVVEATPGGIACAVRAAREGLTVLLVNRTSHLGGILSSGLGVWDTVYEGQRSPIYDELRQSVFETYRTRYGADSVQYRSALPGKSGHTNGRFEPRVIEQLMTQMVQNEPNMTVLTGFIPQSAERQGRLLKSVTLREYPGDATLVIKADAFADCTYEGDLLPLAEVQYRLGREARDEFNEPHAGVVFMKSTSQRPTAISDAHWLAHQSLNLRKFSGFQAILEPESTGAGDKNVQAFNYRTILTSDPQNRIPVKRPHNYDPEFLKTLEFGSIVQPLPNNKICWNRPQLIGPHQTYVEGDWNQRRKVMDAHWQATLALLYFLQHDPSVSKERQEYWRKYGLARDEFVDHDHRPYEMYIREARRLDGRAILTQHDLMPAPGAIRCPPHVDAIAMTDWYMDAHAVTHRNVRGSLDEGKMMLHAETWPGQISWRCLLPREVDNLVVPVCLSATHVAWGAIRLEPTWMQTGEAAGLAVALAHQRQRPVADVSVDELVRELASRRFYLSFFNDAGPSDHDQLAIAVQYFGTKGFFPDYNARLDAPLTQAVQEIWQAACDEPNQSDASALKLMQKLQLAEEASSAATGQTRGAFLLELWKDRSQPRAGQ